MRSALKRVELMDLVWLALGVIGWLLWLTRTDLAEMRRSVSTSTCTSTATNTSTTLELYPNNIIRYQLPGDATMRAVLVDSTGEVLASWPPKLSFAKALERDLDYGPCGY